MRNELIAALSALVLVIAILWLEPPREIPHWSPAEIEEHFQQTAREMGTDVSKMRSDSAVERGRLVVRSTRRSAAVRIEFAPNGRVMTWDCTRCTALAGNPSSVDKARQQLAGNPAKASITISEGMVTKAYAESAKAANVNPQGRSFARFLRYSSVTIYWIAFSMSLGYFYRLFVRHDARRVALTLIGFWWIVFLIAVLIERRSIDSAGGPYHVMLQPLLWLLPCVAGITKLRGELVSSWLGFLHAAQRWRPARRTGVELWNGLLLGWPLALVAWVTLSPEIGSEKIPSLVGIVRRSALQEYIVMYFAFLVPLIRVSKIVTDPQRRRGFLLVLGGVMFGGIYQVASTYPLLDVFSGLLVFGLSAWIYTTQGLMGVMGAALASGMAAPLAWLAGRPFDHVIPLIASASVYGGSLAGAAWLSKRTAAGEDIELAAEIERLNGPVQDIEIRSERQLLLTEFAEAREAQMGMLPAHAPTIPGFSLAAACIPAREVGGDLYDIIEFRDGSWGFCVADVSGKGVPAALYMTMTKGVLASEQRVSSDLKVLTLALNERLHQAAQKKIFVTMAFARLDPKTRCVELIRAGHNPVLWRRAARNETVWLKPGGLGLGLVANRSFQKSLANQVIQLEPEDTLILYSDGLTEAENQRVELYGEDRLQRIVEQSQATASNTLMQEILADIELFKEGADPHDDLTLVVLKVSPADSY